MGIRLPELKTGPIKKAGYPCSKGEEGERTEIRTIGGENRATVARNGGGESVIKSDGNGFKVRYTNSGVCTRCEKKNIKTQKDETLSAFVSISQSPRRGTETFAGLVKKQRGKGGIRGTRLLSGYLIGLLVGDES